MTAGRATTLVLFDIDGTLITTEGAGRAAMGEAAGRLFGRPDLFSRLSFAGAIDSEIVARALASGGLAPTPRRVGRLKAAYLRALRRRLARGGGRVYPGVRDALALSAAHARVGLLTGNWREGARVKLSRFALWSHFSPGLGAYGQDAAVRDGLLPVAWRRARRFGGPPQRIIVIGDTPADVSCARAGARALVGPGVQVLAVAVCTGFASPELLADARPDLLLPDLQRGLAALQPLLQGTGA